MKVETTIHTDGVQWHATTEDKEMYIAIDRVVKKRERQAIKHKEKSSPTIEKRVD